MPFSYTCGFLLLVIDDKFIINDNLLALYPLTARKSDNRTTSPEVAVYWRKAGGR